VILRPANNDDVAAIAALHANSWQRAYRGIYSDAYLDDGVHAERLEVWTQQFAYPRADQRTAVADDDGAIVGFVHTLLDEDDRFGALLDNLHVAGEWQRRGLGTELVRSSAKTVIAERPGRPLYLWVLERNARARAFYAAIGGAEADHASEPAADGTVVEGVRVVWPEPSRLLQP
jgi:ribosomal protein S18 acetylase RimI-like enzyme